MKALVTGVTGQDGSHLADLLLAKGYDVIGVVRWSATRNFWRIEHILDNPRLKLVPADLMDQSSIVELMREEQPDEVYNLAAQSFVGASWTQPILTAEATAVGALRVLEGVRLGAPKAKFYQASSSEMFGKVREVPQNELTPFYPRSPYGVAKAFAHYMTVNYRESYNIFACSGILFNHEGERRGEEFVTRKISKAVARIKYGKQHMLNLGNISARRDWGYAPEYVEAMWRMLQQDTPQDYVIATGQTYQVAEFLKVAFRCVGLGWTDYVHHDESLERPAEVDLLVGNPSKAREILKWVPRVSFESLVQIMVQADLKRESR